MDRVVRLEDTESIDESGSAEEGERAGGEDQNRS